MNVLSTRASTRRWPWLAAAVVLLILGVTTDGMTEAGHHVLFITAGVLTGWGLAR